MRVLASLVAALVAAGLVGVLVHSPAPDAPPSVRAPAPAAHVAAPVVGFAMRDGVQGEAAPNAAPAAPAVPPAAGPPAAVPPAAEPAVAEPVAAEPAPTAEPFANRLEGLVATGDKASFQQVLADWRADVLPREHELLVDQALATLDDAQLDALDAAAGRLLLESQSPTQRQALASLLASSGSQLAARYLFTAAARPERSAEALAALATVSDPEVLPVYRQQISAEARPALLAALSRSLRNMDSPKARALEEQIAALR